MARIPRFRKQGIRHYGGAEEANAMILQHRSRTLEKSKLWFSIAFCAGFYKVMVIHQSSGLVEIYTKTMIFTGTSDEHHRDDESHTIMMDLSQQLHFPIEPQR